MRFSDLARDLSGEALGRGYDLRYAAEDCRIGISYSLEPDEPPYKYVVHVPTGRSTEVTGDWWAMDGAKWA
jgi:hypothetical protein